MALIAAHLLDPAPAPSARDARLATADPVFARALAKDPAARCPRCRDFADDLRSALGLAPYIALIRNRSQCQIVALRQIAMRARCQRQRWRPGPCAVPKPRTGA